MKKLFGETVWKLTSCKYSMMTKKNLFIHFVEWISLSLLGQFEAGRGTFVASCFPDRMPPCFLVACSPVYLPLLSVWPLRPRATVQFRANGRNRKAACWKEGHGNLLCNVHVWIPDRFWLTTVNWARSWSTPETFIQLWEETTCK